MVWFVLWLFSQGIASEGVGVCVCVCSLGTWLAFGCHDALIADVHTDRWDLMVGVSTGEGRKRRSEGLNRRMRRKKNSWLEEMRGRGGREGKRSMERWREKWGREILSCGWRRSCRQQHGQAVNHTEAATFRESKTERQVETRAHPSRPQIHGSGELLENEELCSPDQITLQNKRLRAFGSCTKKNEGKGNMHDLINYAITWYLLWLWYMGNILRKAGWVISSMLHCLTAKKCFNIKGRLPVLTYRIFPHFVFKCSSLQSTILLLSHLCFMLISIVGFCCSENSKAVKGKKNNNTSSGLY